MSWISVKDRLPELKESYSGSPLRSERVLIYNGHYVDLGKIEESYKRRVRSWKDSTYRIACVTHWQPLPEPPREREP